MYDNFIGIDPGKAGGIAIITPNKVEAYAIPETEKDLFDILDSIHFPRTFTLIEKVHSAPGQGVASVFTFGRGYGFLRGCLIGIGLPFDEISPLSWQTALKCKSGGDKNVTKAKAQQLFPHLKITHKTADSLLIAEYNRKFYNKKV